MKKVMKKNTSLILIVSVLITGIINPFTVRAAEPGDGAVIMEVSKGNGVSLREGPGKQYDFLEDGYLELGNCLSVLDAVTNDYGNTWYQVSYSGGTGYIYDSNVIQHEHQYEQICDADGNPIMSICKCGFYKEENSVSNMNAAVLAGSNLLGSEVLGALSALGSTTAGYLSVAFPYVAVVVVSGVVFYFAINSTGTQVSTFSLSSEATVEDFESTDNAKAPYYKCAAPKNSNILLVNIKEPLTLEKASDHILYYVNDPMLTDPKSYYNIYTLKDYNATILANYIAKRGYSYSYGNSKESNKRMEVNGECNGYPQEDMFYHYHIFKRHGFDGAFKKNKKAHIFFGYPTAYFGSI